ncbi:MAG TPA: hypothetical protein VN131_07725 [Mobilitalea sp.]|nr:hypothetical protein [Mobilitalea sp.]
MKNRQIEKALDRAVNDAPLLSFEKLVEMPYVTMTEHDYITKQEVRKAPVRIGQLSLAAACCLLIIISVSGWFIQNRVQDSTIYLDVNPSIEITTNRKDMVLSVKALNRDAESIVGGIDYKDENLTQTVNMVLDSLVNSNYLNPDKNTILLSIKNRNTEKADSIMNNVDNTIHKSLSAQNINPTILKQVIKSQKDSTALARKYHVSEGKIKLIQAIITKNGRYTIGELAHVSVENLVKLAKENAVDLSSFLPEIAKDPSPAITSAPEGTAVTPTTPAKPKPTQSKKDKEQVIKENENNNKIKSRDDTEGTKQDYKGSESSDNRDDGKGDREDKDRGEHDGYYNNNNSKRYANNNSDEASYERGNQDNGEASDNESSKENEQDSNAKKANDENDDSYVRNKEDNQNEGGGRKEGSNSNDQDGQEDKNKNNSKYYMKPSKDGAYLYGGNRGDGNSQ